LRRSSFARALRAHGGCRAQRAATGRPPQRPDVARHEQTGPPAARHVRPSPGKRSLVQGLQGWTPRIVRDGPSSLTVLRGTPLRRAVDPRVSAAPAGLTARAKPKARPEERTAELTAPTMPRHHELMSIAFVSSSFQPSLIYVIPRGLLGSHHGRSARHWPDCGDLNHRYI